MPVIGRTTVSTGTRRAGMLHCAIFLADGRVLSGETFRLVSLSGRESVSQPFQFQLVLHANTDDASDDPLGFAGAVLKSLGFADIVGRPVTIGIEEPLPEPVADRDAAFKTAIGGGDADGFSWFNGLVSGFGMGAPGVYQLTLQPALWRLSLTNAYRVHHGLSIRDAIAALLKRHKVEHSLAAVSGSDNPAVTRVQDWLQAGESDFDFIHRLMAKANIYYYFEHSATAHQLVFANRPNYPPAYPDGRRLRYTHSSAEPLGMEQDDVITDYRYTQSLVSTGVTAALVRQEAAWEQDAVADCHAYLAMATPDMGDLPFYRYQVCQYGGGLKEADWEANRVQESLQTSATELSGSSRCSRFRCGHQFQLAAGEANGLAVRPQLADTPFVLTEVEHQAQLDGSYQNTFKATEAAGLITPFSLHDTQQGVLLAQVVNHDNGTPPRDWRYYQKQNFDPEQDSLSQSDADPQQLRAKGVYVRFVTDQPDAAAVWVKLAPHMQTVPEIGVIVQVSRANDLTELPEIQSVVQNNGNTVVTPSGWTASTNVGSNYSTSYGDSKSVRFGRSSIVDLDDAVAKVTDEYATGKYRDCSYSQGASYSYAKAEQGRDGLLSDSQSLGSTYSHHQGKESKNWSDVDYSYSKQKVGHSDSYAVTTGKSYSKSTTGEVESHSKVTGDRKSYDRVDGESYSKSTQGKVTSYSTINGDHYSKSTINGDSTSVNSVSGHTKSTTTQGTVNNLSTVGAQSSSSAVGAENRNSAVGISNSNSAAGVTNSNSATGASLNLSATGIATEISAIGMHNKVSVVGVGNSFEMVGGRVVSNNAPAQVQVNIENTQVNLMVAIQLIM